MIVKFRFSERGLYFFDNPKDNVRYNILFGMFICEYQFEDEDITRRCLDVRFGPLSLTIGFK